MLRIPHLETDITTACQLSCVGCNHHVPLYRRHGVVHANPAQIEQDLGQLSSIVHADKWGALGGEPLLHKALPTVLRIAKQSKVADYIEVWTNGIALPDMGPEFWRSFDILVLSVYPGKHTDESLDWIRKRSEDAGVRLEVKDERRKPNFRTLLEPGPTPPDVTKAKFNECFFRRYSRVANQGYFFTCCCAPHMPMLLQGQPFGTDGIRIDGLTEHALKAYLERSDPLGACTICAGRETAKPIEWREERRPVEWIAASAGV